MKATNIFTVYYVISTLSINTKKGVAAKIY